MVDLEPQLTQLAKPVTGSFAKVMSHITYPYIGQNREQKDFRVTYVVRSHTPSPKIRALRCKSLNGSGGKRGCGNTHIRSPFRWRTAEGCWKPESVDEAARSIDKPFKLYRTAHGVVVNQTYPNRPLASREQDLQLRIVVLRE